MNADERRWGSESSYLRSSAFICGFCLLSGVAAFAGRTEAAARSAREAERVEVRSVQPRPVGDGLRLEIALSAPAEFRWGRLHRPERVYVDVVGARLVGMPYELRVGLGGVDRLWARQNATDTVRIVLGITEPVDVTMVRAGSGDVITLDLLPSGGDGERGGEGETGRGGDGETAKRRDGETATKSRQPGAGSREREPGSLPRFGRRAEYPREAWEGSRRVLAPKATAVGRVGGVEPGARAQRARSRDGKGGDELPPLAITEPRFPLPAASDPSTVTGLIARNLSADKAEIRLRAGRRMSYKPLRLDGPARYVVDLPGGRDGLSRKARVQGEGLLGAGDVRASQFSSEPPVFRLVVHLPEGAWAEARADESGEVVVEVTRRSLVRQAGANGAGKERNDALLVGIDPGHGGSDPGAMPMVGMPEKDITLDIALRVRELLERGGVATAMTRRDDRRLNPRERKRFVKRADLDLVLSIHSDAAETRSATGVTTYVHGWGRKSRALAGAIQAELVRATGLPDRGVRGDTDIYDTGFYVLREAVPPAVLIEAGYVSHPPTALQLSYPEFRQRVAQGIVAGLQKYLRSSGKTKSLRVSLAEADRS